MAKNELIKIERTEFVAKFEPLNMLTAYRNVKTMTEAIEAEPNGLAFYSKQVGEATVLATIESHLLALGQSLNVHEKLSVYQMKEISLEIITLYYYLSIVEIAYVFKKAKRGEYGKINYSINMPDVLNWFALYSEERCTHFMNKSDSKAVEHKQNAATSSHLSAEQIDILSKIGEEMDKNNKDAFDPEKFQKFKDEYNNKAK